jgi:hypothetical protein
LRFTLSQNAPPHYPSQQSETLHLPVAPFAESLPAQRQRCLESTSAGGFIARLWITKLSTEKTKNNDEPSPSRIVIYSE